MPLLYTKSCYTALFSLQMTTMEIFHLRQRQENRVIISHRELRHSLYELDLTQLWEELRKPKLKEKGTRRPEKPSLTSQPEELVQMDTSDQCKKPTTSGHWNRPAVSHSQAPGGRPVASVGHQGQQLGKWVRCGIDGRKDKLKLPDTSPLILDHVWWWWCTKSDDLCFTSSS